MGLREALAQKVRITERRLAIEWESDLKRTSPVDTGMMRDRTTVRDRPGLVEATIDTEYAEMVSSGTRPHRIVAKNARALRFQWRGRTVIVRSVNHPGTQPNPWWTDSLRRLPDLVSRIWNAA